MKRKAAILFGPILGLGMPLLVSGAAMADQTVVKMNLISAGGIGKEIGTLTLTDSPDGLKVAFNLRGLTPGDHGIHVHENASCAALAKDGTMTAGLAAGGHFDPAHTGHHEGPNGQGHLGDLEIMSVDASGIDTEITTAKRAQLKEIRGHAIVIHAGGDNYADTPQPLGGGGARIACGVIK